MKKTRGSSGVIATAPDVYPGSYTDIETTDAILHAGHHIAIQQTGFWARILDRLSGNNPPKLIVIDPRITFTAAKVSVHLSPRQGSNVQVMNCLINLIIQAGYINEEYIKKNTVGFEELVKVVSAYTPQRVQELSGITVKLLMNAAEILGTAPTLVSTVLQSMYQSIQATAAAQVNNLHLIRGLIGKKGCGIYQMNGQQIVLFQHYPRMATRIKKSVLY